jgi:V8-like Glu-specific endopeptidase
VTSNTPQDFFEQLRGLVADGSADRALERIGEFLESRDRELANDAIVLQGQLNEIRRHERRGTLSLDDADLRRSRVRAAVLDLIDLVKERMDRELLPVATNVVHFRPPDSASLEKIIGANNLKSIAWLRAGLLCAKSICRVVTPTSLGTGFLIGDGRLMTNAHVIPDRDIAARSRAEFGVEESQDGAVAAPIPYQFDPNRFFRASNDQNLDYCVLALQTAGAGVPISEWGALQFEGNKLPEVDEHVTIIQHPSGGPKQIAITANQVVNRFDHMLHYTTDTLPGSSGAPVLNDDWKVIALHHAGGNVLKNARGDRLFANEGILIGAILDDMNH